VFADTVAAKSFKGTNEAHGWMGVQFQSEPNTLPSVILLHVRMWDEDNLLQQQALGIVGINLVFNAFYYLNDQDQFIRSLADNLTVDRIEVDMINLSGPLFSIVDNRLMSLKLVQYGLTNAVMFGPKEEVLQPSEVLYKKAILVERGAFDRSLCSMSTVVGYDSSFVEIFSRDILSRIQTGNPGSEKMVPEKAAATIKERHLFSYKKPNVAVQAL
jgi:hypothetical protein